LHNLQACLEEAEAGLEHIARWEIVVKEGAPLQDGFAAFGEVWGSGPTHRPSPSPWSVA
jgi:hypothetical protein